MEKGGVQARQTYGMYKFFLVIGVIPFLVIIASVITVLYRNVENYLRSGAFFIIPFLLVLVVGVLMFGIWVSDKFARWMVRDMK